MMCSIVLQISSAGFEYRPVEYLFQRWRFMKAPWPYFFLLDVSWALSVYCSHIQVRRWRCMDENDARDGFMRRKTSEEVLQLAAFNKMKCPPRAETALYRTIISSAVLMKSQRLRGIFLEGFLPLQPLVWTVQPRKQSSTSLHIQDTSRLLWLSRTWECPRRACIWYCLPITW